MATPMEYDTLREIYSSAMAALTRLKIKYGVDTEQFNEAENEFVQVWINEVKSLDLEEINYQAAATHMKKVAKPWTDLEEELWQNSQKELDDGNTNGI